MSGVKMVVTDKQSNLHCTYPNAPCWATNDCMTSGKTDGLEYTICSRITTAPPRASHQEIPNSLGVPVRETV